MSNGCLAILRECDKKHRFDTIELPATVVSQLGAKAFETQLERAMRGIRARAESERRRAVVEQLFGKQNNSAIGRFLGITETRVRQIANELGLTRNPTAEPRRTLHSLE